MTVKVLVQGAIVSVISFYVQLCGLDRRDIWGKRTCYHCLNRYVGVIAEDHVDDQGYGFEVRNKKNKMILIVVGNKVCKKWENHLVTNESCPSKTPVDYSLLRQDQEMFVKGIKISPDEEYITQHKPLRNRMRGKFVNQTKSS